MTRLPSTVLLERDQQVCYYYTAYRPQELLWPVQYYVDHDWMFPNSAQLHSLAWCVNLHSLYCQQLIGGGGGGGGGGQL